MSDLPPEAAPWPTAPPGEPGTPIVGFPDGRAYAPHAARVSHVRMIILLGIGLGVLAAILIVVAVIAKPGPGGTCGRFGCQEPPTTPKLTSAGPAVTSGTPYSNAQGWGLDYYNIPFAPTVAASSAGIEFTYDFAAKYGGTALVYVIGGSDGGDSDSTLINDVLSQAAPNAQLAYDEPQPLVGYEPGEGATFNDEASSSDGSTVNEQLIVDVAEVNGFAITVVVEGQDIGNVTTKSPFWSDHPSPAQVNVAYFLDPMVNHIRFPS